VRLPPFLLFRPRLWQASNSPSTRHGGLTSAKT
jgi:hypothetical protein